ncbi:MAG: cytochrome c1 [Pseudomonadota bacterium]
MKVARFLGLAIAIGALSLSVASGPANAAGKAKAAPAQDWHFNGIFGSWDLASVQRGYQVYREACAACHGLSRVAFRNLRDIGFSEAEVATIASEYFVMDGPDEFGDMFEREAIASDRMPAPFPNEEAARSANGGAYPLDLSVIAKARKNGPDYLYSLLIGYEDEPPDGSELGLGMYYNHYYAGHQIAMPQILYDEIIFYQDPDTPTTAAQYSWDVTNFLMWAAEPTLETRKRTGVGVIIFLLVFTGLMYAVKRRVWADVH